MWPRSLEGPLRRLAGQYPVVTLTGPRQSGKTTLCRAVFTEHAYVSLENLDLRAAAIADPRAFLAGYAAGVILDEIQHVPELVSYIQQLVDDDDTPGRFVLTGSQQLRVTDTISQSLAGRTALLKLLPFSIEEMGEAGLLTDLDEVIFKGFYPRLHDKSLEPTEALAFYVETYVERDLRALLQVRNLRAFEQFLKLCATFTGQILNTSKIASACGIDQKTAAAWLSVLEASFIVHLLPPHHENLKKRVVKAPKLFFLDTGLACFLLSMKSPQHVATHPMRGALFESLVVSDLIKQCYHAGRRLNLAFFKAHAGREIDVILDHGTEVSLLEVKSSQTLHDSFFNELRAHRAVASNVYRSYLVYAGDTRSRRHEVDVLPWAQIAAIETDPC